jgi:hypothetical protein
VLAAVAWHGMGAQVPCPVSCVPLLFDISICVEICALGGLMTVPELSCRHVKVSRVYFAFNLLSAWAGTVDL